MFAQVRSMVQTHLNVRTLLALAVLTVSGPVSLVRAQDTRTVNEPTFPATCASIAAQQAINAGEPTSETTFDTPAIQTALNACPVGQAVELTLGGASGINNAFLIKPINIPTGVTLMVDGGVTVFASRNPADYQVTGGGVETCGTVGTAGNGCNPLISINGNATSTGAGLMGFGIINGRGGDKLLLNGVAQTYSWWDLANQANTGNAAQNNPILLLAKKASNFTLYKITLMNSPMFHVKYQNATGFTVWGAKIVAPYTARNTDGIDPADNVSNITINNSYISDGDDMVGVDATGAGNPASNISILNTNTYSGRGISIGSYTSGGVSNMLVSNINMAGNLSDTNAGGLKIKSSLDRGGVVNNIQYSKVCMQNERFPLQFNPTYTNNAGTSFPYYTNIGLHNVTIFANNNQNISQVQLQGPDVNHPLGLTMDNLNVLNGFQVTPATKDANFILGPGPVTPTQLQSLTGPGVTYGGNITNPNEARYACSSANFPFLAGELYLSTATLNNQRTLSLPNPATFTLNAVVEIVESASTAPTSAIQFYEGTKQVGTASLSSNGTLASLTLTGVTSGAHTYTARYPADAAYGQLNFGSVTVNVNTTGTTTTMSATPTSALYGASIALTATVVPASGTVTPTGTVNFQNGATVIGTATLDNTGTATLNVTTLPVGNNAVTAYYVGSTNFATSNSSATPVNVGITQAGTSSAISATPSAAVYGATIALAGTVTSNTSGTPTGNVTFMDGATNLGSVILTAGVARLNVSTLNTGIHQITAVYGGDTNFTASTSPAATVSIFTASTTTQLGFSSGSVPFGTAVTIIGAINNGTATGATGTITFTDNGTTTLAVVPIPSGQSSASYTTSSLSIGTHNVVASYSGDSNYTGSASSSTPLVITQAGSSTTLSTTNASIVYGASDGFTATVSPSASGTPTGQITFKDGSTFLGTATLASGVASFSVPGLTGGTHSITATYGGDGNFLGSTSSPLTITVTTAPSTTTVTVPASITYGNAASLTANIASTVAGTLTGTVTFMDGTTVLGSGPVAGGTATFSATGLTGGTHSITAIYSGDTNYATSTSAPATLTVNKASTTSGIAANPTAITFGGSSTLTASVSPTTATGKFTFLDGGNTLGTVTIVNGTATFTAASLATGTHTLTAVYTGDGNYLTSTTTTAATVTVTQAGSTTALTANPTTLTYLASTVLTATVPAAATGSVTFKDGATSIGSGTIANGVATFTASTLTGGTHSITAAYAGDVNFTGSTSPAVTVTVTTAASTTTVTANPSTLAFGASTVLTATLANTTGTGTVTFKDGSATLGTGTISGGVATFTAASLTGGSHTITAAYSGDTNFAASTSAAITVTVTLASTSTTLTATPSTITFGGSTTLTATVSNTAATGTVIFKDGTVTVGTGTIGNGVASAVVSGLGGGTHAITAIYSGDANFATSTSAAATVSVNPSATSTGLAATPATAAFGSSVKLTATIAPGGVTPAASGAVIFKDGATTLGTGTVTNGTATFSLTTLSTGTHSITATYSGDANYGASASASVTVTITQVTSTISVVANPSSITFGSSTTLTATVAPASASGTVTFKDGATTIGSGTLANGVAAFSTSALTGGSHSITAVYSGDTNDAPATSAATAVSVGLLTTVTTLSAAPTTFSYGTSTTLTAAVSPANVTGSVTFSDGATVLGTSPVSAGGASLTVPALGVGVHNITATYSGDANNGASTSGAVTVTVSQATTTTTLSAPATGSYGTPTVITVTVAPAGATGTVTFTDGGTALGTAAVSGGVATFSANLSAGSHVLSASYSGSANYAASATTSTTTVVIAVATTTVLASGTPSSTTLGAPVTLSATVTPAAATGTITFRDAGTGFALGTATLAGGTASVTGVVLSPAGAHQITATYSGDLNDGASTSAAVTISITPAGTVVTLTNTPASPVMYGASLTLSTTMTTTLGVTPTGTIQYLDGTTVVGSAPLKLNGSGAAVSSFTFSSLMPGTHQLTAVYSGDGNYRTNTSAAVSVTVNQSNSMLTMVANPPQTVPGQAFTLTATAASVAGTGTPTGTVTFFNQNNVNLGTVALAGGSASITQTLTTLGSYSYTATYSGDVDFTTSTTTNPTVVAVKQLGTTTAISATPASGTFGTGTFSLTAIVTPASGGPSTGSVTFMDGTKVLGTVALPANDTATLANISLAGGVHSITALYSGDPTYAASISAPATITVNTAAAATSLSVTPATSSFGTSVTFSAAITSTTGTVATGTVTFMNGASVLGTATLGASGIGTFTSTTLPIAVYNVTAVYSGDTNFAASTSAPVTVTVTQLTQTITLSGIPTTLTYGATPITIANTASSGLAVTLAVTGPASLNGSILTITGAGTVVVTATQAGNATYSAAPTITSTIVVAKAPLTVTIANLTIPYNTAIPALTGTVTGVVNGDQITATYATTATATSNPGTYPITATLVDPAGKLVNYAVTNAGATLTISANAQTITFPALPATVVYGAAPITLTASASSSLAVVYSVVGPASITGSTLTITGAGSVVVTAAQPGNSVFSAATSVSQTIAVTPAPLTVTVANQSVLANAAFPTFTGTLTGVVNGDNITATYATTATPSSAPGTYPITATLVDPGNRLGNYTVTNTPGTLTISVNAQTITFPALPATVVYGSGPITLGATASSALPVTYTVTAGLGSVTGSTLTITGAGTLVVTASQAGNTAFAAATPVSQTIIVSKAALTVTAANQSRAFGVANPTLTGTLTGVVNGDNITATYQTTATIASAVGSYPITPTLADPANRLANYTVTTTAGTLTVTAGTTTIALTLSAAQIFPNGSVTLTATLSSPSGAPTSGTVTFLNGAATLGTGTVTAGVATLTLNNLPVGTYTVTAAYAATGNYAAGVSNAQTLTVTAPVTLALSPASLSLAAGATGTSTLTLTPSAGFTGPVTLTCLSPVAYVTCMVTTPVTIAGTTPGTATVTIGVAATYGFLSAPQLGPDRGPGAIVYAALVPFGALLLLPLIRRRKLLGRKGLKLLALLLMAAGMSLAVTGCGTTGSINPHLPPAGAQVVTITATAASNTITTSLTVNVTN